MTAAVQRFDVGLSTVRARRSKAASAPRCQLAAGVDAQTDELLQRIADDRQVTAGAQIVLWCAAAVLAAAVVAPFVLVLLVMPTAALGLVLP